MKMLKDKATNLLVKATGLKKKEVSKLMSVPPNPKMGDLAFPCFTLAKKFKKAPGQVSVELRKKIAVPKGFSKIEAVGPFLNFYYNPSSLAKEVLTAKGKKKKLSKVAVVEFPSPNTNKPLHLGHLRNLSLGESMSQILKYLGWNVKRVCLYNDRGVHVCKSMLAYQKWGKGKNPNKKPDHFIGDFYVMFANKAKKDPKLEAEAQEMLQKWEKGDKKTLALWKKLNKWVFKGFNETYKNFHVKPFVKNYLESNTYKKGKKIIMDGLKKGKFYKDKTGAIMFDLDKYGFGQKVMIRSDGTTVYITQDMYLAQKKYSDFKYTKSIFIVGNEQIYHFNVLFKALEILKLKSAKGCYHLAHGLVYLPEGKMKSREGKVVDADDIIEDMVTLAKKEVLKRNKLSQKKATELAKKIGVGAIKYFMLKYDAKKDFTFNPKQSIAFDGDTGPYLQYALVRATKILKKSKKKPSKRIKFEVLNSVAEMNLLKQIAEFEDTVQKAADTYAPNIVATYAYTLAQKFATFYEKHRVIGAPKDEEAARLFLVSAFANTLRKSITLLGLQEVELM